MAAALGRRSLRHRRRLDHALAVASEQRHLGLSASWRVSGTYFESCNCDAICPCRSTRGAKGGLSTHGVCDFALSWWIKQGNFGDTTLESLTAVMVGSYIDQPKWTPWQVALLVDERASPEAQKALEEIFLGRAGGTPMANFAEAIGDRK